MTAKPGPVKADASILSANRSKPPPKWQVIWVNPGFCPDIARIRPDRCIIGLYQIKTAMTPLRHNRQRLFDLQINDRLSIGNHSYTVKKTARGGMGMILFVETQESAASEGVHRPKLALKGILPGSADERGIALFRRELTVWSAFRHRHVVSLNEILDGGGDGWIAAMDWFPSSLRDILLKGKLLDAKEAWRVVANIFDGLSYAYDLDKVLHLDLKPENVLFGWNAYRVSDWGIASIKQPRLNAIAGLPPGAKDALLTFNNIGTILYMAPERFLKGYHSSVASDVFALGMIWLELLTGKLPSDGMTHPVEMLTSRKYLKAADELLRQQKTSGKTRKLILSMLAYDPKNRPIYSSFQKPLIEARRSLESFSIREFFFGKPETKPEDNQEHSPLVKQGVLIMGLEYARKQALNLDAVGRREEGSAVMKKFVQDFMKNSPASVATDLDLARISYQVAYFIWPQIVYKDWTVLQSEWASSFPPVISFPITVALLLGRRLSLPQLRAFRAMQGELMEGVDYYMMQFPVPPEARLVKGIDGDMEAFQALPKDQRPVLGPYFAVALRKRANNERKFYVLGQAIEFGTTLRCVTAEGLNCNCGSGPLQPPDHAVFLRLVESVAYRGDGIA